MKLYGGTVDLDDNYLSVTPQLPLFHQNTLALWDYASFMTNRDHLNVDLMYSTMPDFLIKAVLEQSASSPCSFSNPEFIQHTL